MVSVFGGTVLLIGIVMVVAPGPALVFIPAGLAILATEFVWAARLLRKVKRSLRSVAEKGGILSASSDHAGGTGSTDDTGDVVAPAAGTNPRHPPA